MKIAFVVQRCGTDVFGGAEALTLQIGLELSKFLEVEILTTRAREATTWKNYYRDGVEKMDNLVIRRFSVDNERDPNFVPLSQYLEMHNDDMEKGIQFINASGPVCNRLLDFIKENSKNYDLFVFVGYLYWLTFYGMPLVSEKSLLMSTAHDEPWIYFKIYEKIFELPKGYLFLTNAEKEFVHKKFDTHEKPYQIVGHGIDTGIATRDYKTPKIKLPEKYLLYVGRISSGKGCKRLSDFFNRYIATHNTDLKLVMLGSLEQKMENHSAIILENLPDDEKFFVIKNCQAFIMPSQFESLNIACLEAWLFKKPILVNAESMVLLEHCKRSNGGLYYSNYEEFHESLDLILSNEKLAIELGLNGEKYVKENYNWEITIRKYREFFSKIIEKIKTH